MLNKADFILWLIEAGKRLNTRTPKFFRVVGAVSLVASAIGLIPDALVFVGIVLPDKWMFWVGKAMFAAGIWGKIVSALVVKVPTPEVMPYTVKNQIKDAKETGRPDKGDLITRREIY